MAVGVVIFAAWLAFMAITVVAFVIWAFREGQLKDVEEPKYRMLQDREPEPWPGREDNRSGNSEQGEKAVRSKGESE
jgi:nitrogen fixation-related uncharacterized protein